MWIITSRVSIQGDYGEDHEVPERRSVSRMIVGGKAEWSACRAVIQKGRGFQHIACVRFSKEHLMIGCKRIQILLVLFCGACLGYAAAAGKFAASGSASAASTNAPRTSQESLAPVQESPSVCLTEVRSKNQLLAMADPPSRAPVEVAQVVRAAQKRRQEAEHPVHHGRRHRLV